MLDHWILRARLLSIPYGLKQIATSWLDLGLSTTPIMVRGNATHTRRTCLFPPLELAPMEMQAGFYWAIEL